MEESESEGEEDEGENDGNDDEEVSAWVRKIRKQLGDRHAPRWGLCSRSQVVDATTRLADGKTTMSRHSQHRAAVRPCDNQSVLLRQAIMSARKVCPPCSLTLLCATL